MVEVKIVSTFKRGCDNCEKITSHVKYSDGSIMCEECNYVW